MRAFQLVADSEYRAHPAGTPANVLTLAAFSVLSITFTFCYPAVNVGPSTGFAVSTLLALACVALGRMGRGIRLLEPAYWAIVCPYMISGFLILNRFELLNQRNVWVGSVVLAVSVTSVMLPRWFAENRRTDLLVIGCGVAFWIHGLAGAFQLLFVGKFPAAYFVIFDNNSYALAEFATRPMGVFPEPSAMTTVLGPLLLFCYEAVATANNRGLLCRGFVRLLIFGGLTVGIGLAVVSRSGFAPAIIGMIALRVVYRNAVIKRNLLMTICALLSGALIVAACWWLLAERIDVELRSSSSWETRFDSLVAGWELWTSDLKTWLLGVGANQLHLHMEQLGTYSSFGTLQRYSNVFSITLTYLVETGVFGVAGLLLVCSLICRSIVNSANRFGGFTTFILWALGATFAASYHNLYGVWFNLGVLVSWDRFFPRRLQWNERRVR